MAVPLLAWYFGYCMEQNSPANQLSIRNIHFVELPYDPAILLMGVFPYKTIIRKVTWEFAWWSSGEDSALSNVGDYSSIPEQGAGSYMLQWRVPHAAIETWCSQINKYFFKRYMHPMLATLFTIAQTWKQPKWPSTEEWIKKMWYVDTMEYYHKKMK